MTERKVWTHKKAAPAPAAPRGLLPMVVYTYCKCPQCGGINSIVFKYPDVPATHKCCKCLAIVPPESFIVISYTNEPLPPLNRSLQYKPGKEEH
jgi:hypothetical protein